MRLFLLLICLTTSNLVAQGYRRATDDPENVKNKKFEKKGRIELDIPDVGFILNQPLITTFLLHAGLTYYSNEIWGYQFEASMGLNQDEEERECLENFYNDPLDQVEAECGDGSDFTTGTNGQATSNFGPAYMPIREINYIIAGNIVWNPVYGKQLLLKSATSYFDFFVTMGGGVVMSDYYEQRNTLDNGRPARADYDSNTGQLTGGAGAGESNSYGESGRPAPQSQTHPFINLGLGQKYHFWKRYSIKVEFRNMTLLATPGGFENLFAIWTGFGIRF